MRGRAERILNTIQTDEKTTETILTGLFGDVEKETDNKQKVKKDGYMIALENNEALLCVGLILFIGFWIGMVIASFRN